MARTIAMRRGADDGTFSAVPSTERLDRLAHLLDSRFSVFGVRFGLDSIMGLVPGIGDAAGLAVSAYLIGEGYRMGARKRTLARMGVNVLGDTVVGAIPLVGTVIDVFWKANNANMRLLKRDLGAANPIQRF